MIKKEITDSKTLEHLSQIEKDGMSVFIMADGRFRGAFFNGTELINQMRVQHNLGILETMVLGQGILCAAMMIQTMKGKEHIVFRYETNGACKGFSVEVDSTGYVRGYLLNNPIPIDKPLESWDLEPFFGDGGTVTITRYIEGGKEPQIGTTEIVYKNIAKDLTYYFLQSEQINTAFNTSIQFDKEGRVIGAGGLFLQSIPVYGGKKTSGELNEEEKTKGKDKIEDFEIWLRMIFFAVQRTPSVRCRQSVSGSVTKVPEKMLFTDFSGNLIQKLLLKETSFLTALVKQKTLHSR